MNKVYNNQENIARGLANFISSVFPNIRKTQLKIIPYIIFGMIVSESVVASDIAKVLKNKFDEVYIESVIKRINRFFKNKLFNAHEFYDKIIRAVIKKYKKKHNDKRVHINFDHMFSHDNYTVFMISMRVGKQGIPLWFRSFKGRAPSEAMQEELIKDGLSYVSGLFDESFDLIFLADRWFNSTGLMEHINNLGHTYVLRLKKNMKVNIMLKKETEKSWRSLNDLPKYKYHSVFYENVEFTDKKYITTIVISDSIDTDDPWILATNGNPRRAIKDYSYRFGGIECIFKNQKSNGFNLEKVVKASEKYFESLYTLVCVAILYLTILGADYSKNTKYYRNVKLHTHTKAKGKKKRILSLFNTGLMLFKRAFNSTVYIRLPFSFVLHDV